MAAQASNGAGPTYDRTTIEIVWNVRLIKQMVDCGVFSEDRDDDPLRRAAFTQVLIALRDLLAKCHNFGTRVDFTDDVIQTDAVRDVTDVVTHVRNALCHVDSDNNTLPLGDEDEVFFNYRLYRHWAAELRATGLRLGSDYDDDIAYCFGEQRIYWERHVMRAFNDAKSRLNQVMERDPARFGNVFRVE